MRHINDVTGAIVDSAIKLHMNLGPGLLESCYERILACDLERRGLYVERQKSISFEYDNMMFDDAFRADLVVDRQVVVELKSVERTLPVHSKQVLTYLRLTDLRVGLLLNFGEATMRTGIHRIVNKLDLPNTTITPDPADEELEAPESSS